jgi:hypothetical protein
MIPCAAVDGKAAVKTVLASDVGKERWATDGTAHPD